MRNANYETVEQWEKQTGKKYPDTAPVYEMRFFNKPLGTTGWICHGYESALRDKKKYPKRMTHNIILVADDKGAPPVGWEPEEEKPEKRRCRVCGCTDDDCHQCIEKTGEPCYWVEEDLCSACAEEV